MARIALEQGCNAHLGHKQGCVGKVGTQRAQYVLCSVSALHKTITWCALAPNMICSMPDFLVTLFQDVNQGVGLLIPSACGGVHAVPGPPLHLWGVLWVLCRFAAETDPAVRGRTAAGITKMRELCEAALTAAGLHATEGGKLWSQYRQVVHVLTQSPRAASCAVTRHANGRSTCASVSHAFAACPCASFQANGRGLCACVHLIDRLLQHQHTCQACGSSAWTSFRWCECRSSGCLESAKAQACCSDHSTCTH